ncbi:ATP-binding cassette domain-containing protein [Bacteriovorax stolpii]|uniref:ABC transporter ATP-binding protein n=1 Tax=Bacteriovorax stolpii TaxID=960 RepID=A0A2K9NUY5_BACTC|nr:ATP-binding cassette domain-containing protein [Bacteriovorax stolpii]AUN99336.1 ABC transporter ATP-binding protein [Bacteriovorax stolpii]QDK40684.1 ATP-binding cassette domain-containing protein [Bacteriovorax stolpii]TDP55124.1 phospholipid/cholesterol/gamma-HCH transport system ATP-binding protein [Bacteriovorax stolpii]
MLTFENPAISIKNVTKIFGEQIVLDSLNFDIERNKITTILGFSGAGKSTLLKHILGIVKPTSGTVEVLGQDLAHLGKVELREFRRNYGMLFQYAALFDSFTAEENVAFPLKEFTNKTPQEIHEQVKDLLISVGIKEESFSRLPSELSGGMRKRVGLARALALSPAIMLYDEPTTGLDPITTKMVNNLIVDTAKNHKDREMTSVIISHDVKATLEISDYVAFLDRGKIIEYLPVDEFKNSKKELVQEFLRL